MQETKFIEIKDIQGNGFDGNGNNSSSDKFVLTDEELKELVKDFI